jgi:SAM-dependent methyltransferase
MTTPGAAGFADGRTRRFCYSRPVEWHGASRAGQMTSQIPRLSIALPAPPGATDAPIWTGTEFRLDGTSRRVLAYDTGPSGWSQELYELHQEHSPGDHFIDVASRRHALDQLARHLPQADATILEIGCSGGYFLRELAEARPKAELIGADYTLGALDVLGRTLPGIPLLQFDLTQCPLPDASVDAVVLLNVFEHIERDDTAMAQVFRILRPGGIMVAEVPAGPALYDVYDQQLMHCRRYAMAGFRRLVEQAGFVTIERSHLGFWVYPAFWLTKKLNRLRPPRSTETAAARVETAMRTTRRGGGLGHGLMRSEAWLRPILYLPFGIRCLITARKPGTA